MNMRIIFDTVADELSMKLESIDSFDPTTVSVNVVDFPNEKL